MPEVTIVSNCPRCRRKYLGNKGDVSINGLKCWVCGESWGRQREYVHRPATEDDWRLAKLERDYVLTIKEADEIRIELLSLACARRDIFRLPYVSLSMLAWFLICLAMCTVFLKLFVHDPLFSVLIGVVTLMTVLCVGGAAVGLAIQSTKVVQRVKVEFAHRFATDLRRIAAVMVMRQDEMFAWLLHTITGELHPIAMAPFMQAAMAEDLSTSIATREAHGRDTKMCQHDWGFVNAGPHYRCNKCGATKPVSDAYFKND